MNATSGTDFTELDQRRRRLRYRLWHRGTREMDLIMGRFADAVIGELADTDIGDLERLAEVPDPELYAWFSGVDPVPATLRHGGIPPPARVPCAEISPR